jgi:hypothetical protein
MNNQLIVIAAKNGRNIAFVWQLQLKGRTTWQMSNT